MSKILTGHGSFSDCLDVSDIFHRIIDNPEVLATAIHSGNNPKVEFFIDQTTLDTHRNALTAELRTCLRINFSEFFSEE